MIDILMFPITEDIKSVQNSASTAATSLIQKIIAEGSMMHSSEPEVRKLLKKTMQKFAQVSMTL